MNRTMSILVKQANLAGVQKSTVLQRISHRITGTVLSTFRPPTQKHLDPLHLILYRPKDFATHHVTRLHLLYTILSKKKIDKDKWIFDFFLGHVEFFYKGGEAASFRQYSTVVKSKQYTRTRPYNTLKLRIQSDVSLSLRP